MPLVFSGHPFGTPCLHAACILELFLQSTNHFTSGFFMMRRKINLGVAHKHITIPPHSGTTVLSPLAMDMEIDPPKSSEQQPKAEDLFKAAEAGDASVFKSLSQKQLAEALSLRNDDARSVLHVAVSSSNSEVVKVLLAADESKNVINSVDEDGWSPLHSAASIGNSGIVELLLSKGADVNLKNGGGRSALHYAASKGWLEIAQILISHGAKVNLKDKVGCTPLHRAASTAKSQLCELLIEEGAEVDAVDRLGQTPIMSAVICYNQEVSLLLVRHGADVDVEDKEGYTVLGRASKEFRPLLIDAAKAMLEG
ncbi:26S proteasome non-ATPase regulatory subunit 10 isoform X1 [Prunus avium]|uniref:26S proteasome non-ATPase regulatory subunit 10 isoform X1 n=2 Tax=Prunus avium TaxID=42229 RepID=A0A6P5RX00_PRUAV|nr:26S proteasome non-ATPase regulatory subunit 10 isoform X1 [Prunus avium]